MFLPIVLSPSEQTTPRFNTDQNLPRSKWLPCICRPKHVCPLTVGDGQGTAITGKKHTHPESGKSGVHTQRATGKRGDRPLIDPESEPRERNHPLVHIESLFGLNCGENCKNVIARTLTTNHSQPFPGLHLLVPGEGNACVSLGRC